MNGFVSPSANSKATTDFSGARDGATFETAQTVENKTNFTMDQLCERGSPIAMFVSGKALPLQFHDQTLTPASEQAMYMGTFRVMRCEQEEPLEKSTINDMVAFYKEYYDLDCTMLRFHLEVVKKYRAVPVAYLDQTYTLMEVDKRDDRKPLFSVPPGESYQALLSTEAPNFISEKEMITEWIEDGSHLEILEDPYKGVDAPPSLTAVVPHERYQGNKRRALNKRIAQTRKRRIQFSDHWRIMLKAGVASFARLLEVNVDSSGCIGPLIDRFPLVHKEGLELVNYSRYFTVESPTRFLDHIGPEFQKSPTDAPIRSYDPKVMLLMKCNGGGPTRMQRDGLSWMKQKPALAADLFFQCILVEVVKVTVLVEWSRVCRPSNDGYSLPRLSEIPEFLEYVEAVLKSAKVNSTNSIIQEQYEVSENFDDKCNFFRFFRYLAVELEPWLGRTVSGLAQEVFEGVDTFGKEVKRLATFISQEEGLGSTMCSKAPFLCQHVWMNVNETVDDFPSGMPKVPVVGFGGSFGAQLLQEATFDSSNPCMVQSVMDELLKEYNGSSCTNLRLIGVEKVVGTQGKEDQVVISNNGRLLTTCDVEHGCCICYYFFERKPGCTKGSAKNPKVKFSHCHPIPTVVFHQEQAEKSLYTFVEEIEGGLWSGELIDNESEKMVSSVDEVGVVLDSGSED